MHQIWYHWPDGKPCGGIIESRTRPSWDACPVCDQVEQEDEKDNG